MKLTSKLIKHRKIQKMSQQEVAFFLGIAQSTYHNWETGTNVPNLKYIPLISKFFNIPIHELFEE
ncbi:helix-turn-helix transcriptional regulator [Arcicella aquatica]|uniref:Helix-turn-helix transcriptional regulator n=1 Tax=Arcicella aquatica TaxID=217141 RepID=A0ABU5QGN6_9BACT|nr:helix-turn-helix transcriptional regulator [Arcicella aquatica]MEA5256215.1 helix-turn-helix transcriptional regulator [Arcicella aquatica]